MLVIFLKAVPPTDWFGWDERYHNIDGGGLTRRVLGEGGLVSAEKSVVIPKNEAELTTLLNRSSGLLVYFRPSF
jgi:hypothetical protein